MGGTNNSIYIVDDIKVNLDAMFSTLPPATADKLRQVKNLGAVSFAHLRSHWNIRVDLIGSFAAYQALKQFSAGSEDRLAEFFTHVDFDVQLCDALKILSVADPAFEGPFRGIQHRLTGVYGTTAQTLPYLQFEAGDNVDVTMQETPAVEHLLSSYHVRLNLQDGTLAFRDEVCYEHFKNKKIYTPELESIVQETLKEAQVNELNHDNKKPGAYKHLYKLLHLIRSHIKYKCVGFILSKEDRELFKTYFQDQDFLAYVNGAYTNKMRLMEKKNGGDRYKAQRLAEIFAILHTGYVDVLTLLTTPLPDLSEKVSKQVAPAEKPKPIPGDKNKVEAYSFVKKHPRESISAYISRIKEKLESPENKSMSVDRTREQLSIEFRSILDASRGNTASVSAAELRMAADYYCNDLRQCYRGKRLFNLLNSAAPNLPEEMPFSPALSSTTCSQRSSNAGSGSSSESTTHTKENVVKLTTSVVNFLAKQQYFPARQVTTALLRANGERLKNTPDSEAVSTLKSGMLRRAAGIGVLAGSFLVAFCNFCMRGTNEQDGEREYNPSFLAYIGLGAVFGASAGMMHYKYSPPEVIKLFGEFEKTVIDGLPAAKNDRDHSIHYAQALSLSCQIEYAGGQINETYITNIFGSENAGNAFWKLRRWLITYYKNETKADPNRICIDLLVMIEACSDNYIQDSLVRNNNRNVYFPRIENEIEIINEMQNTFFQLLNAYEKQNSHQDNKSLSRLLLLGNQFCWQASVTKLMLERNFDKNIINVGTMDFAKAVPSLFDKITTDQINAGTLFSRQLSQPNSCKLLLSELSATAKDPLWSEFRNAEKKTHPKKPR